MSRKLRIYVDTSVIGGCLDDEFREASVRLMTMFGDGRAILLASDVLLRELEYAPSTVRQILKDVPLSSIENVAGSVEARRLQSFYLDACVVGLASADDAMHVALATVSRADMIVSWNFKHIVHFDKMRGFNAINVREGYGMLTILSPLEVS